MKTLDKRLKELSPNVFYSTHHEAHQYYSFYTSPFEKATCLSIDGVGEIMADAIIEWFDLDWHKQIIKKWERA